MSTCYSVIASTISELGSENNFFFFQKFLFHSGLKGLSSEIRSAYGGAALFEWKKPNTSKPLYVQTVDYGKDVNRVQKVRFYAHKHNVEEATVYISFAVASMFCTKSQGWEQISVSFQNLDCPWSFFFTAVMLQYIITASFYLGLHMKFSSIKQLIVPARCLYSFIYWDAFFCFSIRSRSFNQEKMQQPPDVMLC